MILKQFTHQAIDRTADGREALKQFRARCILVQGPLDRLKLPNDFFVRFSRSSFSRETCDIFCLYPKGVW